MTTPTSQLGMSHIQTEFGGSNPIALSEYYGVNANVPASGTIRMAQFLGISAGVYWYWRRVPLGSYNYIYHSNIFISGSYMLTGGGIVSGSYRPYVQYHKLGNTASDWAADLRISSSNTIYIGYPQLVSVSPNGTHGIATSSSGSVYLIHRFYTANGTTILNGSCNTTGMGGWHKMIATDTGFIKYQPGYNTANVVLAKWSGDGTTLDWYYSANLGTFYSGVSTFFNSDSSRVLTSIYFSTGTSPAIHCFNASTGAIIWGYKLNTSLVGVAYIDDYRTDSSNNFYVRYSTYSRDFSKFTDNGSSMTEQWRKAVPTGNTIRWTAFSQSGILYLGGEVGGNAYVTRVNADGTAAWTRLFRSLRSTSGPLGQLKTDCLCDKLAASDSEVVVLIRQTESYYDTIKMGWELSGQYEQYMLRIPIDGSKTGNYMNLAYETTTTMTLTAQTNFGLTANTPSNTALLNFPTALTSNNKANVLHLVANTALKISATSI